MFSRDGGNLIPEKPQILGMGVGIEPVWDTLGMGKT